MQIIQIPIPMNHWYNFIPVLSNSGNLSSSDLNRFSHSNQIYRKTKQVEPPETIVYILYTPNPEFKKNIQQVEDSNNLSKFGRVRVPERTI